MTSEDSVDKSNLRDIKPFESEKYENLDLNRLAVYAISYLQENHIPVTFETIVVTLFHMFPKKFSLVGFEQYPDAVRVNRTLLQLRPKYRNWATGDVRLGYSLTELGEAEVERTKILLERPHLQKPAKGIKAKRTRSTDAELRKIEDSDLHRLYKNGRHGDIGERDVLSLLGAFAYTPRKAIREYMAKLKGAAEYNKKSDVIEFLRWIERSFPDLFREPP